MTNGLLNCPFCGGKAKRKSAAYNTMGAYGTEETSRRWYGVFCSKCRIGQPYRTYSTREESDMAWNNRVL